MPRLVPHRHPLRRRQSPNGRRIESAAGHFARPAGQFLLPEGRSRRRDELRRADPHGRRRRVAPDQRPFTPGGGGVMKVAILYDAGSEEWSPQDVAAVVGNVHEVRDVLRRRGHEVELLPVRLGDFRWLSRVRRVDLVFNLCEGINGHARYEEMVVGTLELAGVPFTGCRTWPTTICHRKHVANTLLAAACLCPPSPWPRPTRPPASSRCRPSSSHRPKTPASASTTAPCAPPSGRSRSGSPSCWSSSRKSWSRSTWRAASSTWASSASACCRLPRSCSTPCPMARGPS